MNVVAVEKPHHLIAGIAQDFQGIDGAGAAAGMQ
jgi:hypothetical protein